MILTLEGSGSSNRTGQSSPHQRIGSEHWPFSCGYTHWFEIFYAQKEKRSDFLSTSTEFSKLFSPRKGQDLAP